MSAQRRHEFAAPFGTSIVGAFALYRSDFTSGRHLVDGGGFVARSAWGGLCLRRHRADIGRRASDCCSMELVADDGLRPASAGAIVAWLESPAGGTQSLGISRLQHACSCHRGGCCISRGVVLRGSTPRATRGVHFGTCGSIFCCCRGGAVGYAPTANCRRNLRHSAC